jgi:lipid II:glycine glycyltransferase (peptidoglycan interpeptide bridge formation enzyme)
MVAEMTAEEPDRIRLYLAHHRDPQEADGRPTKGDLVAATLWVRVGRHTWYSYGASTAAKREVQGSTAVQWQMMRDALAAGATVYDLRGITDTVAADDPHAGLIRFKVGTGGEAVEYVGEWDLPLNRLLYRAFDLYLRRRG